jgi:hypothetical protein
MLLFHFRVLVFYNFLFFNLPLQRVRKTHSEEICGALLKSILFPSHYDYSYANSLTILNLRTLHERRHQLDAIFAINVFLFYIPWIVPVCKFPIRNSLDFPLFHVSPSFKSCPSARRATGTFRL